ERFEGRLIGRMALVGAQKHGYKLSPYVLESVPELNDAAKVYVNVDLQLLYAQYWVPVYAEGIESGLQDRLSPRRGSRPILHIISDQPQLQVGETVPPEDNGASDLGYSLWDSPHTESKTATNFSGPCVHVEAGFLHIASSEQRAVYRVNPLSERGDPDPNIQLSITYPDGTF
ncbi:MAG: hypothetical protein JWL89_333, partial [Candidatus Saccharibacteria bacterium]|nr:hypothetical protein [Candidatus Saccharibacteria bacterium]